MTALSHTPVLLKETVEELQPAAGEVLLDVTLGLGGHACALIDAAKGDCTYIGLDADEQNLSFAKLRLDASGAQVQCIHANFGDISSLELPQCDAILADLGLSSPHVDDASRGFSFRFDGPLDLRFDRSSGETAVELIERSSEDEIAGVLRNFGELWREAKPLARALAKQPPTTTFLLRDVVRDTCGYRAAGVLPKVFQALRIAVNDELGALDRFLEAAPRLLQPGGRMAVISYHSLEDRRVKHAFRSLCTPDKDPVTGAATHVPPFAVRTAKPIIPSESEMESNPRSRSAKLRILVHTGSRRASR